MRIGLLIGWIFLLGVVLGGSALLAAAVKDYEAVDYKRRTIYHSPETPGYTCWTYATVMPDGSVILGFYQATGPKDGRPRAPIEVQKKLEPNLADPRRDLTGLNTCNVYLRSTDGGDSWKKVSEDHFRSPMNGVALGLAGLRDGTIVRGMLGSYLRYDADVPKTGLVQRSLDGTKTWGKLECILPADKFTVCPVGIRELRDGRVMVLGAVARGPSDRTWLEYAKSLEPLLMVSSDGGKTWGDPIPVIPENHRTQWGCEECDAAELPNGDLFWIFRRPVPEDKDLPADKQRHTHWQGVTEKQGDTWTPKWVGPSPFGNQGLPNLVVTRDGAVLNINACHWTADVGKTWRPVKNLPGLGYYPKGVQLADGRILVFAHVGSDDAYGSVDQSIIMSSFRLKTR